MHLQTAAQQPFMDARSFREHYEVPDGVWQRCQARAEQRKREQTALERVAEIRAEDARERADALQQELAGRGQ